MVHDWLSFGPSPFRANCWMACHPAVTPRWIYITPHAAKLGMAYLASRVTERF